MNVDPWERPFRGASFEAGSGRAIRERCADERGVPPRSRASDAESDDGDDRTGSRTGPVSVVIPTYQRSALCLEAVRSALGQTVRPAEVIVVDDGSTDDTAQVIGGLGPPVKYVYQKNSERGAARNRGVAEASQPFVAFLDSDDLWHRRHLEISLQLLASHPEAVLAFGRAIYVAADGTPVMAAPGPALEPGVADSFVAVRAFASRAVGPPHSSVVVRREIVARERFCEDRTLARAEDFELWMRIASRYSVVYSAKPTVFLRIDVANTSREAEAAYRAMTAALRYVERDPLVVSAAGGALTRTRSYIALECARLFATVGRRGDAVKLVTEALRHGAGRYSPLEVIRLGALIATPGPVAQRVRSLMRWWKARSLARMLAEDTEAAVSPSADRWARPLVNAFASPRPDGRRISNPLPAISRAGED